MGTTELQLKKPKNNRAASSKRPTTVLSVHPQAKRGYN